MKYAVLFQSKSGNTGVVAQVMFEALSDNDKKIYDIDKINELPKAEVYFVGFGVQNYNCSLKVIDILEKLRNCKCVLFATCGFLPKESYKENLVGYMKTWLPDTCELLGMFLCQGKAAEGWKQQMLKQNPTQQERLLEMFQYGEEHPDCMDLSMATEFVKEMQKRV